MTLGEKSTLVISGDYAYGDGYVVEVHLVQHL
jgi:FKBP-type peptidyl-prolyl cis-trans isomerase